MHLAADECKARAQLQQEFGDAHHQGVAFLCLVGQAQKVETMTRVFQRLTDRVGLMPIFSIYAASCCRSGFALFRRLRSAGTSSILSVHPTASA